MNNEKSKITIFINKNLHKDFKIIAEYNGYTMNKLINRFIRQYVLNHTNKQFIKEAFIKYELQ